MSDLQDALDRWDIKQRPTWVQPIVKAARREAATMERHRYSRPKYYATDIPRWNGTTMFKCLQCGVMVSDPEKHQAWHETLRTWLNSG